MTTITTVHPATIATPRGATWAAEAAVALADALRRLFTPRPRAAIEDVEAVRAYANRLRASDPGMAADLFAAADRHELRG